jgi:hypothetical protein
VRGQKTRFLRSTAKKVCKILILQKKRDLNPVPNGEVAADIAKMFFLRALKNTIFAKIRSAESKILYTLLQNSDSKKKTPIFAKNADFRKNTDFCEKRQFLENADFKVFYAKNADFCKKC